MEGMELRRAMATQSISVHPSRCRGCATVDGASKEAEQRKGCATMPLCLCRCVASAKFQLVEDRDRDIASPNL